MGQATEHQAETEIMTIEDAEAGVRESLGMTLDELRRQAAEGRFSSERARLTWRVLSGVGLCTVSGNGKAR